VLVGGSFHRRQFEGGLPRSASELQAMAGDWIELQYRAASAILRSAGLWGGNSPPQ
jgi:hypothetical protein